MIKVFAVYDNKAKYFLRPFMAREIGEAVRAFSDAANDKSIEIGRHPEDYILYKIAEFDDEKGIYKNEEHLDNLGLASSYVNHTPVFMENVIEANKNKEVVKNEN